MMSVLADLKQPLAHSGLDPLSTRVVKNNVLFEAVLQTLHSKMKTSVNLGGAGGGGIPCSIGAQRTPEHLH